jgi:hypothetical protein
MCRLLRAMACANDRKSEITFLNILWKVTDNDGDDKKLTTADQNRKNNQGWVCCRQLEQLWATMGMWGHDPVIKRWKDDFFQHVMKSYWRGWWWKTANCWSDAKNDEVWACSCICWQLWATLGNCGHLWATACASVGCCGQRQEPLIEAIKRSNFYSVKTYWQGCWWFKTANCRSEPQEWWILTMVSTWGHL